VLTYTATPDSQWVFGGWTYDLTGTQTPANLTATDETLVFANFNIVDTPLTLTGISPASANSGGAAFTLTLNGTGFSPDSVVGVTVGTTTTYPAVNYISSTQMTVQIPATAIASPGVLQVYVESYPPGTDGCAVFGYQPFVVHASTLATSTTVVSSGNPSAPGTSVTFTAAVTSAESNATGMVTFKDGSTTLGTGALNGAGVATYSTASLAAGTHGITAVYGGDTYNAGSTSSVLTQTVSGPAVSLSATSVPFGEQNPGTESDAAVVTLTNTGNAALTINSIVLGGANPSQFIYGTTTSCSTVAAGGTCTFRIRFYPTASGTDSAVITITDNAAGSPHTISLTGTGIPIPVVTLSAASVPFGNENVKTESAAQVVTLTNTGKANLSISSIALTGANPSQFVYGTTTSCATIAAGGTCTFRARFYPTTAGADSAAITITDNAAGSPHSISLTGTGILAPAVSLSATTVAFGNQNVKTESAAQVVTLTNTGNAALSISSIALTGANPSQFVYGTTTGCSTIAVNGTCTFRVRFNPTVAGAASAAITITDNAAGSPQSIALTGTGVGTPVVSLSATTVPFGNQAVKTESAAQVVTLTNTGTAPLTISSTALTGTNPSQFIYGTTTSCATVAAGGTCTFRVRFAPTVTGAASAAITITDNASGSPHAINLTGTGQ
jgi:hypothetical protein